MKLLYTFAFFIFTISLSTAAAEKTYYYAIEFIDKNHNFYTLDKPAEFLSPRALKRRKKQNIKLTAVDLPLSTRYIYQIEQRGAHILHRSKWLNTVIITCTKEDLEKIKNLSFVKEVGKAGRSADYEILITERKKKKAKTDPAPNPYGDAFHQINMLGGIALHDKNHRGAGMLIAVLDAGFWRADDLPIFGKIQENPYFRKSTDFVAGVENVFDTSEHGTEVLSVMAADLPGTMVGTAPDAAYVLLKTEDLRGEYHLDEYTWVAGMEYADSLGADIAVSGLGYTRFDDPTMNYTFADLGKNKAISTRGAEIATAAGMIVVCSAGNEGENDWQNVSCPADGSGVLAVGARNLYGKRSAFSSRICELNGRMKPDVDALGEQVAVAAVAGAAQVRRGRGTSYSAPIVAGLVASLWSAFPTADNESILNAVRLSAAAEYGNRPGFPDFNRAFCLLAGEKKEMFTYKAD